MQKVKDFYFVYKKKIFTFISIVIILLCLFAFTLINNTFNAEEATLNTNILAVKDEEVTSIKVDVKGAVNNPGVYELTINSRVIDAVELAGGLSEEAHTKYLNLSKIIKDQDVILINTIQEIDEIKNGSNKNIICEDISDACVTKNHFITSDITGNTSKTSVDNSSDLSVIEDRSDACKEENISSNTFVNINKATKDELANLDGIGESKAQSIIDYRNTNGLFKSIEEIMNVSGIGTKAYEKIKNYITV